MRFSFDTKNVTEVKDRIVTALGGRELGKMVNISIDNDALVVTINKLGVSTLRFSRVDTPKGVEFNQEEEKIAFAHRLFKEEVKQKICRVIEQVGGTIQQE